MRDEQAHRRSLSLLRFERGQAAGLLEQDLTVMGLLCLISLAGVALAFRPLKTALFDMAFAGSVGLPTRLLELAMTAMLVIAIVIGVRKARARAPSSAARS